VVIASGGPSLARVLPLLQRVAEGGVLMAAPQALPTLLDAGLRCDLLVHPDPSDLLTPALAGRSEAAPFAALLADASVHPAVLDRAPERCFLFHLRSPQITELAWREAEREVLDEAWVTVSEVMFFLARQLGAHRIVLAGFDFISDTRDYGAPFEVQTASGQRACTNPVYFHAARFLDHAVKEALESGVDVLRLGASEGLALSSLCGSPEKEAASFAIARDGIARESAGFALPAANTGSRSKMLDAVRSLLYQSFAFESSAESRTEGAVWRDFAALPAERARGVWRQLRDELRR